MDSLLKDIENDPDFTVKKPQKEKESESKDVITEAVSLGIGLAAVNRVTEL